MSSSLLSSALVIVPCVYVGVHLSNAFALAQGVERNTDLDTAACIPLNFSHMVAEQRCFRISTARVEDVQKVGEQPGEFWVEEQNAVVPQMVEQWLEVPKILPQDRVLQTAKQIADHLDKRAVAGMEDAAGRLVE